MEDNMNTDVYKIILNIPQNIGEKILIARNVYNHLNATTNTIKKYSLQEVKQITGVDDASFEAAVSSSHKVKSFKDWCLNRKLFNMQSSQIQTETLRRVINRIYIDDLSVVTEQKLVYALKQICYNYQERMLHIDFSHHGFTWKRLPGTNKSIVVEKPEQFMQRMAYLTKIRNYRQEGRPFVYVLVDRVVIAASSTVGLINILPGLARSERLKNLHPWIGNILITLLPPKCVVVACETESYNHTILPKSCSSKADLCKWLSENGINYDPLSAKADLFLLVKTFSQKRQKLNCNTAELLNINRHDILWIPTGIRGLNYFNKIQTVISTMKKTESVQKYCQDLKLDDWIDFEKCLIEKEISIYQEDVKVDAIVDKLLTLAKYGKLSDSDLKDFDDVKSYDYMADIII